MRSCSGVVNGKKLHFRALVGEEGEPERTRGIQNRSGGRRSGEQSQEEEEEKEREREREREFY
jgi:hypothetical protein